MDLLRRFKKIDEFLFNGVYLYGAGVNGEWVHNYLNRINVNVIAFIDSNVEKQGTVIDGLPCISYTDYLNNKDNKVVLITSKHYFKGIFEETKNNPNILPFDTWFALKYQTEYQSLLFEDDYSYKSLNGILDYMKTGEKQYLWNISDKDQYFSFAPFWGGNLNETFVDIGACTGDSSERFIQSVLGGFNKIYAFEPGVRQFIAMKRRFDRIISEWDLDSESIILENIAVGAEAGYIMFSDSKSDMSYRSSALGNNKIRVVSLDKYFESKEITFIKADIEGSEYDMIIGAIELTKRCLPKMAISVYHLPDDLLRIYELINSLNLGYKFKLRQHSNVLCDTVLYCYV